MNRRLEKIERLTVALACNGTCPRCCGGAGARPARGRLTPREQATTLMDLLDRAGLVFIADEVGALDLERDDEQ